MDINKVNAIWLAAAVNTYEVCKRKTDWEISDVYFKQMKIVSNAKKIIKDEIPATMASQQCCAYTPYTVYKYLVSNNKLRRISYSGEFYGDKERPEFDKEMNVSTSLGEIKCEELYRFIDEEFTPMMKEKIENKYAEYDIDIIFQYLKDYIGKTFIAVEKAEERADEMSEHKIRGTEARRMLSDISEEIKSFMPKYANIDISRWINQGQKVDHYIWSELKKNGKENFPSSISIFIEKNADEFQLRISVEVRDSKCKNSQDYFRHNRLLEIKNINPELKYFVVDSLSNELVVSSLSNEELKKEVANGTYKKVQICKIMPRNEVKKKSGREIIEFIVKAMNELESFYDLAVSDEQSENISEEKENYQMSKVEELEYKTNFDNNMILYGPPGTGKTYNTILYAVAICDDISLESLKKKPYGEVLNRFKQLKKEERVAFTTFHQSYGYEEFIEGIKPKISQEGSSDTGEIKYEYSDGIFKKFCKAAGDVKIQATSIEIGEKPKVWNILLDGTGESELKKRCFDEGYIKIGWKQEDEIITEQSLNLTDKARRILLNFQDEMKIGDIILTQKNNNCIDGIGVVTGTYTFDKGDEYPRTRNVRWIKTGINESVVAINKNTNLDRKSVYPLSKMDIDDIMKLIEKYTNNSDISIERNKKPYVFIIDEINRGNISKIFGELITLIEDTKRIGAEEEMKVKLPYSSDEFGVPNNVYLLGTMNTADRSIALMDTALRRRFKFIEMMPDSNVLTQMGADKVKSKDGTKELDIVAMLDVINERIKYLYDREHTIGHAFFTVLKNNPTIEMLAEIFSKSVIPLLQEYFYEDYSKIQLVLGDNDKSDNRYKFILDSPIKIREVFNGNPEIDLPDKKYTIQREAFYQIESYLEINKHK